MTRRLYAVTRKQCTRVVTRVRIAKAKAAGPSSVMTDRSLTAYDLLIKKKGGEFTARSTGAMRLTWIYGSEMMRLRTKRRPLREDRSLASEFR